MAALSTGKNLTFLFSASTLTGCHPRMGSWEAHPIQDLKVRKAAGPSGVTGEMIKATGEQAVDWLTSICNRNSEGRGNSRELADE